MKFIHRQYPHGSLIVLVLWRIQFTITNVGYFISFTVRYNKKIYRETYKKK